MKLFQREKERLREVESVKTDEKLITCFFNNSLTNLYTKE